MEGAHGIFHGLFLISTSSVHAGQAGGPSSQALGREAASIIIGATNSCPKSFLTLSGVPAFSSPADKVNGSREAQAHLASTCHFQGLSSSNACMIQTIHVCGQIPQQVGVCHLIPGPEETKSLPHVIYFFNF